jgi:hypothetical protein
MPGMDTTDIERLLHELEHLDPADAPGPADAMADHLAAEIDDETPTGADS